MDNDRSQLSLDEMYMARCLQVAKNGFGTTFPNPMVGCVIVHKNKIIGEGFTSPFGGSHAEVNAIKSVLDKSLLPESTIYVSLEPCSHYGKTPPCADLIVSHGIHRAVIGCKDPHEKVAGKGIAKLKKGGCEVVKGVLEKECREHHRRFLNFHTKKRPYIILKWAETKDGFLAPFDEARSKNPEPFWISNSHSKQLVHQWRSEEQGILVGTNTVLDDNPKLNVRLWEGSSPTRIVLDRNLRIPSDFHVMGTSIKTIVLTEVSDSTKHKKDLQYELVDFSKPLAKQICDALYKHQVLSVIIEGGAQTLETFIEADLWDEARVIVGNAVFENGIVAPKIEKKVYSSTAITSDQLKIYRNASN